MKLIILLLATVMTFSLFGQDTLKKTPGTNYKKLQIGINFSTDICYRRLINNDGSATSELVVKTRNTMEAAKIGYTTGLNIAYNFSEHLSIASGVQFSNKGYKTSLTALTLGEMIDPIYGFVNTTTEQNPNFSDFIYKYYFIDIPLKVNYIIGKRKIRFISAAGITLNIFIKEEVLGNVFFDNGNNQQSASASVYSYRKINLSPFVSLGVDWKLNERSTLRMEPTFRYGILKIIDTPVSGYLWNAGLNVSYYYSL